MHILDEDERRFIIEQEDHAIGIVELVEIDFVHRNCEVKLLLILIIVDTVLLNKLLKWP